MPDDLTAPDLRTGLRRLDNQHICGKKAATAAAAVAHLGMVQAQDYLAALWAVGLRMAQATETDVEAAVAERQIVRTWPARGTLHFVAALDVHWMLALLTRRAVVASGGRLRRLDLDESVFRQCRTVLTRALCGGRRLTRPELFQLLESQRIATAGQRGIHILWKLAQDGLLCFGPRQGKQHTFVLLEEWIPRGPDLSREQALAELARRYFNGHGPASLDDFSWWSGLTKAEASLAVQLGRGWLTEETWDGIKRWSGESSDPLPAARPRLQLLPAFDEYLVGYQDREDVLDPRSAKRINAGGGMLNPVIVIDGQVRGTWRRVLKRDRVIVQPAWFSPAGAEDQASLARAAERYGRFLQLAAEVE